MATQISPAQTNSVNNSLQKTKVATINYEIKSNTTNNDLP